MRLKLQSGLSLGYRTRGAGRLVVLLHPVGTRAAFWDPAVERLAGECRTLAVDFRGHGESDTPAQPFTLDDLASDIIELLEVQGARDAVLVGCSLGGMVAQGVALRAPQTLAGIVLADTNHEQSDAGRTAMTQRAAASLKGMPNVVETTIERWFPAAFRAKEPQVVARVRDWLLEDDPVVFSWCWQAIRGLAYGGALSQIALPALVLRGAEDAASAREPMQAMAKLLPRGRFVEIPGAGHAAPYEQPEAFVALLREFLKSLPAN